MTTLDPTDPVPVDPVHPGPETPWVPPLAGTETEALPGPLDRLRRTFRYKADGLDAAGLDTRVGASSLTAVLGDGGRVGEDPPPGWRPVAGDSAVWGG